MQIGFSSQRLQLEWLEFTVELLLSGEDVDKIKIQLEQLLYGRLSGGPKSGRGSLEKMVSIIMKTWVTVPGKLRALRDDALGLLRNRSGKEHLPLQWGMVMAAYPFWAVVAEVVGRLLRLQDTVSTAQVRRRVQELLGERESVARAGRLVVNCFVDWGVLSEAGSKGFYQAGSASTITDMEVSVWLMEALLLATGAASTPVKDLIQSPALFPFRMLRPGIMDLEKNGRLQSYRHGLDEEMVMLRGR